MKRYKGYPIVFHKPLTRSQITKLPDQYSRLKVVVPVTLEHVYEGQEKLAKRVERWIFPQDGFATEFRDIKFTIMGTAENAQRILLLVDGLVAYPEGADICSKCGDVGAPGSMMDITPDDFDLLCDACRKRKRKKARLTGKRK